MNFLVALRNGNDCIDNWLLFWIVCNVFYSGPCLPCLLLLPHSDATAFVFLIMSRFSGPLTLIWRLWSNFHPACVATGSALMSVRATPPYSCTIQASGKASLHELSLSFLTASIGCYLLGSLGTQPTTNPLYMECHLNPKTEKKRENELQKSPHY